MRKILTALVAAASISAAAIATSNKADAATLTKDAPAPPRPNDRRTGETSDEVASPHGRCPRVEDNTLAQHGTTTVQCGTAKGLMSALGQKQDIRAAHRDVRFTPKSGHRSAGRQCPLCAKSGLMQCSNFRYSITPSHRREWDIRRCGSFPLVPVGRCEWLTRRAAE
jgi:hypothetical protein